MAVFRGKWMMYFNNFITTLAYVRSFAHPLFNINRVQNLGNKNSDTLT